MTVHPSAPGSAQELGPRIVVVGVGGAGGNAVHNMIQSGLEGVEFLVANTDAQALELSACERRVQLGRTVTRGLGAGSHPEVGRVATEESLDEILPTIESAQMLFITAGMGGGTGTGGAPVIARAAREAGVLTVGVVTKPFHFEGVRRMQVAEAGLDELAKEVDTLIVIPNQNLFRIADDKMTFADAFRTADEVLHSGVRGVTDLMVLPGLINLDFADIQAVMAEMGKAIMGSGEAVGENRALEAAEAALTNPLLDADSIQGARGVLINIAGGMDLTLFEVDQAANRIREEVDGEANIIFGSVFDQRLEGRMRVSVVATGFEANGQARIAQPGSEPRNLIVGRSIEDKPALQKASPEPTTKPAQATPCAPNAETETARDEGTAGIGAEAAGPVATGKAEIVFVPPEPGPEKTPMTPTYHKVPAPKIQPTDPPARETVDATRSPGAGTTAVSASVAVSQDSTSCKSVTGEPNGSSPASPVGEPDALASDGEVDAAKPPAEPSDAEGMPTGDPEIVKLRPAPDSTPKRWPLFKSKPKLAQKVEANAEPLPKVKEALVSTADAPAPEAPTFNADSDLAARSETRPWKRRTSNFFSRRVGRRSDSAEKHFEIGERHYYGQGVGKCLALALRSYREAAEHGHAEAQNRLGWMYEKGEGVEVDYNEAVAWHRRAVEQGHVNAMNDLGYMYRYGWGVTQSYSESLRWFRKAAEKYDHYAEYNIGQMYENGWGVEKDLDEGIRWFRRSAARGHEWAAHRLDELGDKI